MGALTKDRPVQASIGEFADLPVLASTSIYDGSIVGQTSAGYARPFVLGDRFRGHAAREVDNSAGASGAKSVHCYRGRYFLRVALSGVALADAQRSAPVFAQDSGTLSLRAGQLVGRVVFYETSGYAIVEFDTELQAHALSETVLFGGFTDNLDNTGYIDFSAAIPAGSIVIGWQAHVVTGFTGNTSALVQVGDSSVLGLFTADSSQSVYAAGDVGSGSAPASAYAPAAVTPRVTVTSATDFTSVSAGAMDVKILYLPTLRPS